MTGPGPARGTPDSVICQKQWTGTFISDAPPVPARRLAPAVRGPRALGRGRGAGGPGAGATAEDLALFLEGRVRTGGRVVAAAAAAACALATPARRETPDSGTPWGVRPDAAPDWAPWDAAVSARTRPLPCGPRRGPRARRCCGPCRWPSRPPPSPRSARSRACTTRSSLGAAAAAAGGRPGAGGGPRAAPPRRRGRHGRGAAARARPAAGHRRHRRRRDGPPSPWPPMRPRSGSAAVAAGDPALLPTEGSP